MWSGPAGPPARPYSLAFEGVDSCPQWTANSSAATRRCLTWCHAAPAARWQAGRRHPGRRHPVGVRRWEVEGTGDAVLGPDGVTQRRAGSRRPAPATRRWPTSSASRPRYLRRLRAEHLDLYDANVNGWLQQQPDRQLLIRTLRGAEAGQDGIARAVLSGRYRFVDNLDVLLAVLDGIRSAGADVAGGQV